MEPQLGHWFWVHGHGPGWTNRATGHLGDIGWARAYWDGRLSGRICEEVFGERVDARPIFMKALAIVDKMRVMRWETVEAVLQEFIDAVDYAGREGSSIPE